MLHECKTTTNMIEQFATLAAIAQNPGKIRDDGNIVLLITMRYWYSVDGSRKICQCLFKK